MLAMATAGDDAQTLSTRIAPHIQAKAGRAIYSLNSPSVVSTPEAFVLHPTPKQLLSWHDAPKKALKTALAGFGVP